ncbi:hypothetical protein QFC21_007093 [Naganishia friedmannii]|uniref:Uncharacterized protein n=1 Tax=Naganishia friedmannii TaxID=89922 RepID=A0ACC2UY61_9TREE|nr:hypothetical protein QFC21_007093 [Naganishia friedmannii]
MGKKQKLMWAALSRIDGNAIWKICTLKRGYRGGIAAELEDGEMITSVTILGWCWTTNEQYHLVTHSTLAAASINMAIDTTDTLEIDVQAFGNLAMADDAFPTEIYGIIGQFLAGDAAFGTLASLNTANHSIRDETLPMLYETVCFKSVSDIPECSSDQYLLPERFRHTK